MDDGIRLVADSYVVLELLACGGGYCADTLADETFPRASKSAVHQAEARRADATGYAGLPLHLGGVRFGFGIVHLGAVGQILVQFGPQNRTLSTVREDDVHALVELRA